MTRPPRVPSWRWHTAKEHLAWRIQLACMAGIAASSVAVTLIVVAGGDPGRPGAWFAAGAGLLWVFVAARSWRQSLERGRSWVPRPVRDNDDDEEQAPAYLAVAYPPAERVPGYEYTWGVWGR